ncbi:BamA/TamA family outer membrane protein [Algoriphagus zhangzhouensis]|uniref:Calcineurin-like phosphoesterase n=1 Tax=Algoriphagus zhangzhouensis TaxID=1073327 RepID=A0A1M7Z4W4_9BACT|nr:BamA/TamA family outer membrane protein [Algoriphagus zhangzhouensis]TDY48741.1 calcineurin-like phosphoesterase family protein [Algoriphagus zhangzhouensis]SHO59884.1 Calcineurin-like phosphoesterase [Algoriphagus zhangzhouensis]
MKKLISILFLLFWAIAADAQESEIKFRVYLIGDAGELENEEHPVIKHVRKQVSETPSILSHVLFLGDNIYPQGMPAIGDEDRKEAEFILKTQLDLSNNISGKIWMVPGNHDWKKGKSEGWDRVLFAEEFIEDNYPQEKVIQVPSGGCPGPYVTLLDDETLFIAFDSQWWLHQRDKPGLESDCEFKTEEEILASLNYLLEENQDKTILFAMHHPMRAYGPHNGGYSWKDHLFPLTAVSDNLYLPLPLVGSIYPLYRTWFGDIQDIPHPQYEAMIRALDQLFTKHPHVIQVSGHEHGLSYTQEGNMHYIVSGAGAKDTYIKKNNPAEFTYPKQGYAILDFYSNNQVTLQFMDPLEEEPLYESNLIERYASNAAQLKLFQRSFPETIKDTISNQYLHGKGYQLFLGSNYRETWAIPATFPVLDLAKERGGLRISKRGGGMQTRSLRLENPQGKEFVLRSINKYPENALTPALRQTIAKQVVQDQISSSHPYAALAVARLADAAEVVHTNPKIVYLPDDPLLGVYREDFGNGLYLYEEREIGPKNSSDKIEFFSTDKMLKKIRKDNDNQVNQKEVLKARLFDLWIGDWDRHDDQWRWVGEKQKGDWEFIPMPRDRDQAFFVNQGLLPKIASRKWASPKFQGFDYELKNVNGFMFNGRYFDRSFLTNLDQKDWEKALDQLDKKLTEEVIDEAFRDWPIEVQNKDKAEIKAKLLKRKAWLKEKSLEYYRFLSKDVNVVGSNKNEEFEVKHLEDGNIRVQVRKINKSGDLKQKIYDRTFSPDITDEIHLYGLEGEDQFTFLGEGSGDIKIRLVPGNGVKTLNDEADLKKKSQFIYLPDNNTLATSIGKSTRIKKAYDPDLFAYNRKEFKYDKLMPLASIEFNKDDGVFFGAGVLWEKQGFKKEPYSIRQSIKGNWAFKTNAFNLNYQGHAVDRVGKLDVVWEADVRAPDYAFNYFGQGNETTYDLDKYEIRYYRARFSWYEINAGLQAKLGEKGSLTFGPHYQVYRFDPDDNEGKFITSPESGLDQVDIDHAKFYTGLSAEVNFDNRDNIHIPSRGFQFQGRLKQNWGINEWASNFTRADAELALFWSFKYPSRVVWASRFGAGKNWGDYEYFQGHILGGMDNLRGFRRYRFNGRAVAYNNTEVRVRVLNLKTYVLPATIGVLGFHDIGRVWLDNEKSNTWHHTFGMGLWIAPLNQIVATLSLGFNEEETLPFFSFGYQF